MFNGTQLSEWKIKKSAQKPSEYVQGNSKESTKDSYGRNMKIVKGGTEFSNNASSYEGKG